MHFSATRLAPSPTGALHLGHARTFLIAWWMARQTGAKIYMRMEDLDAGRAKQESVQQAYDDLRWLGMDWDAFAPGNDVAAAETEAGIVIQSRRMDRYTAALGELATRGHIYPCTCTRADIAATVERSASAPHESDNEVRYPGTCFEKLETQNAKLKTTGKHETHNTKHETQNTQHETHNTKHETAAEWAREVIADRGKAVCFRLRVREGLVGFQDFFAGAQEFDVARSAGDFPITRFWNGTGPIPPAYQLACVLDDHAMDIDLVIRGDDLLASTPRQWLMYEALGWKPPAFAHVPLVIGPDGRRLAKRHGESRIAQFRSAGVSPERIVGWAAWRAGQMETPREIAAAEMAGRFEAQKVPRERVVLGPDDLAWLAP